MKRNKLTKVLTLALSAALMLSPMTAFAANITGTGEVEDVISKKVANVVFPTTGLDTAFDFTMDPQGLLSSVSSNTYSSAHSVYFANEGGTYSNKSDELKVINKSSYAVDVSLGVTVKNLTGTSVDGKAYEVKMTNDSTFADDTNTSLYLALNTTPANGSATTKALTSNAAGAGLSVSLNSGEAHYEITESGGSYSYAVKSSVSDNQFDSFTFSLTGACNQDADWMAAKNATPTVEVVWGFGEHVGISVDATGLVTITDFTGDRNTDFASFYIQGDGTVTNDTAEYLMNDMTDWDVEEWSAENGGDISFKLSAAWMAYYAGETVTVRLGLTDGTSIYAYVAIPAN